MSTHLGRIAAARTAWELVQCWVEQMNSVSSLQAEQHAKNRDEPKGGMEVKNGT